MKALTLSFLRGSLRRAHALPVALLLSAAILSPPAMQAQRKEAGVPEVGPERGSLVIVGGAMRSPDIYRRFIQLAGGRLPGRLAAPERYHSGAAVPWQ